MPKSIFITLEYLESDEYTQDDIDYLRATLRNLMNQGIIKIDIYRRYSVYIDAKEDSLDD